MDDLDLERLKQQLDDVSSGSCYEVDDIMREAGVSEKEPDKEDLEQLMRRFGIHVEQDATAPLSESESDAVPVAQDVTPEKPEMDPLSGLFRAADQTHDLIDQQNELADQDEDELEAADPLEEQDDVFAQLFAQLGEIEQNPMDDMFSKPEGHTQTAFIDPRTELDDEPEEEPDLMERLFDQVDLPQTDELKKETDLASVHMDNESAVHADVPEDGLPETEVFEPAAEQATQIFESDEPEEVESTGEVEELEETEAEPVKQPEKKGFWSKWFGVNDDDDKDDGDADENEQAEAEEQRAEGIEEPIAAEPDADLFQSAVKPTTTQVLESDEPEEVKSTGEVEELEETEAEPVKQPEKKGFWSKWFGVNDDDDEDDGDADENDQAEAEEERAEGIEEPIGAEPDADLFQSAVKPTTTRVLELDEPEETNVEEVEAPDIMSVDVSEEPEEVDVVPQPVEEDRQEEIEDAGIAAFEDAMAQEEAIGATEETPEPPHSPPEDTPVISEEELEEFLSGVEDEDEESRVSFEQILRDNGMEESAPLQQKISLEKFPEKETTLYFDIPVRERTSDEPHHTELFDAEEALALEPEDEEWELDSDPEWLNLPLEKVCELAPALQELRSEGPVMAREVVRQKDWILERRRIYLDAQRADQQPPEKVETKIEEDNTEPDDGDVIDAAGELRALLEQEANEEGRDSVFNAGSTDKPETEPADRETEMTETMISLEMLSASAEEETKPAEPKIPAEKQSAKRMAEKPSSRKKPKGKPTKQRPVWPQEEAPRDLNKATKAWRQRARAQAQRSVLVVICTVLAIYISCAADFSILPLPASMNYVENPTTVLTMFVVLQLIAMVIAYDVVVEGIQAALHRSPNFSTLVDLALALNLIHCIARLLWEGEEIPYTCVALLALFAQMRARVSNSRARHYVYKVAASPKQSIGIFCHNGDTRHLVKAPIKNTDAFVAQTVLPNSGQKIERMITILAMSIAVVLSGIVCAATGDIGRLTYVLAATMTGACQIALLSAVPMANNHAACHMMKGGSAVDGIHSAWDIATADTIVLTDEDLFPAGSVALERLELRSRLNDTTALAYAAALAGESSLGHMLAEEVRTRYGAPLVAHHAVRYTGGGMGGNIGGLDILLGSADFMAERGVIVSGIPENGLVLAVDGDVAAILVIDYHVPAAQFNAMQILTERRIKILLHTRNHQITPELVQRLYGLREGTVILPDLEHDRALRNAHYLDGDVPHGILLRDGLVPLADFVSTAQAQARLALAGIVIGIGASIICMLLMMYLCYVFVPADARPIRLLLYMILCFIPIFFIENGVGRE